MLCRQTWNFSPVPSSYKLWFKHIDDPVNSLLSENLLYEFVLYHTFFSCHFESIYVTGTSLSQCDLRLSGSEEVNSSGLFLPVCCLTIHFGMSVAQWSQITNYHNCHYLSVFGLPCCQLSENLHSGLSFFVSVFVTMLPAVWGFYNWL